jgi:plastocyanin
MPISSSAIRSVVDEAPPMTRAGARSMQTLDVWDRRLLPALFAVCALLGGVLIATPAPAATFEVRAVMSKEGADVYFDPVGLRIQPGDTVRWIQVDGYHSITAYHPANGDRELRIPERAQPWNSDVLLAEYPAKGSTFEHTFTVPGVYDYLCIPHEAAGMVGRIVVGEPEAGPGTRPFGYAPDRHWKPVPPLAQKAFPPIALIMERGSVSARAATAAK